MGYHGLVLLFYPTGVRQQNNYKESLGHTELKCSIETKNILWNAFVQIKDQVYFTLTQNYVYSLECIDCDPFYIGKPSRENKTRPPPNSLVDLENP